MSSKRERCKNQESLWRAAGLCTRCGKRPPKAGYEGCAVCLKKARLRHRLLWATRQMAGICPACGGNRNGDKFIICEKCRARQRDHKHKMLTKALVNAYNRKWKNGLRRAGLCSKCGGPIDTGPRWCSKCQKKARDYYYRNHDKRLVYDRMRHHLNYRPRELCPNCGNHRKQCPDCGKWMKVKHQDYPDSCLFTCNCSIKTKAEV